MNKKSDLNKKRRKAINYSTMNASTYLFLLFLICLSNTFGQVSPVFHVLEKDISYFGYSKENNKGHDFVILDSTAQMNYEGTIGKVPKAGIPDGIYYVYQMSELDGKENDTVFYSIKNITKSHVRGCVQKFHYPTHSRESTLWRNDQVQLQWSYDYPYPGAFTRSFMLIKNGKLIKKTKNNGEWVGKMIDNFSFPDSMVNTLRDSLPEWEVTVTPAAIHFARRDSIFISQRSVRRHPSDHQYLYQRVSFFDLFVLDNLSKKEYNLIRSYNNDIRDSLELLKLTWESNETQKTKNTFTAYQRKKEVLSGQLLPELIFNNGHGVFISRVNSPNISGDDSYITLDQQLYHQEREKVIRMVSQYISTQDK